MPFTEDMIRKNMEQIKLDNKRLLAEAKLINFQYMKDGRLNFYKHTAPERGLFFIKQAIEKHGNRYGYSLVLYKNADSKVIIECPIHGQFNQSPSNHLRGNDCPKCMGVYVPTTEQWVAKARELHGARFDYSKVVYKGRRTPVIIGCTIHGEFLQAPEDHLKSDGCSACSGKRKPTTDEFIQKAKKVHSDKYQYHLVQYKTSSEKVEILCPIHGSFFQSPNKHLQGQSCPKCSKISANSKLRSTKEEFIEKARSVHGDKYDYSSVQYNSSKEKIEIVCLIHGSFFQAPNDHLRGRNCPKCSGNYSSDTEEFMKKALDVHGDKYDYSKVMYKNNKEIIEIRCPEHGSFFQTPTSHLNFRGCPKCAGKNHDILYLLKCLDTGWYKIGITTDNVQKRLSSLGGNLKEVHHVKLEDPRKHEAILHKRYEKDREYNLCVRNGHTEFFSLTEEKVQEVIAYMDEVSNER